jgi:hypothetical protein
MAHLLPTLVGYENEKDLFVQLYFKRDVHSTLLLSGKDCIEMRSCDPLLPGGTMEQSFSGRG